ncbi:hypothetical protein ONE63_000766 [Megalurothrips usitatus]|uniref:Uncharacterized protein n=1 Tax=Megalurothrips usitatus TaxID=439358 RepID=A0AAV7Y2Z6_9NEOP|nr:hypothetical protein ONE63_000766 [Megalurothrips usitatus]
MSKKEQDLAKLRKRLEQPSRKTRRSTDLRRSLGRKSVGDINVSDLLAYEQASTPSGNSSFHLSPDSAILDHDFAENPDWYTHLQNKGVLVSDDSINKALLKEREARTHDDSDVGGLDLSSFDKGNIHNVLKSSVAVGDDTLEYYKNKNEPGNKKRNSSIGSVNSEGSFKLPSRTRKGLRRGVIRESSHYSESHNEFDEVIQQAVAEEDDEVFHNPKGDNSSSVGEKKNEFKRQRPNLSTASVSSNGSFELPMRTRKGMRGGKRRKSSRHADSINEFDELIQQASSVEKYENFKSSKKDKSSALDNSKPPKHNLSVGCAPDETSFKMPQRTRPGIRRGRKKQISESSESIDEFENVIQQALSADGDEEIVQNKQKNNSSNPGENKEPSNQKHGLLAGSSSRDTSFKLPQRTKSGIGRGRRKKISESSDSINEFEDIVQQASDAEGDNQELGHHKNGDPTASVQKDTSFKLPQRTKSGIGRGRRRKISESSDSINEFEDIVQQTSNAEGENQELGHLKDPTQNAAKDFSKEAVRTSLSKKRLSSQLSAEKENSLSRHNGLIPSSPFKSPLRVQRHPSSGQDESNYCLENTLDSETNTSLPLGAEANNLSGVDDVQILRKQKLSLGKAVSRIQNAKPLSQITEERSVLEPSVRETTLNYNKLQLPGNISKVSSNATVTDHTRSAPLRVATLSPNQVVPTVDVLHSPNVHQSINISVDNGKNLSKASGVTGRLSFIRLNQSLGNSKDQLILQDLQEQEVNDTLSCGLISPKSAALTNRTEGSPHTSPESSPRGQSVSSTATTVSLPSNLTPMGSLPTECASDSVFGSLNTDSVFKLTQSKSISRSNLVGSNTSRSSLPPSNVAEIPHNQNESWTENPYVNLSQVSPADRTRSFVAESEIFEEDLSDIEADDEADADIAPSITTPSTEAPHSGKSGKISTFSENSEGAAQIVVSPLSGAASNPSEFISSTVLSTEPAGPISPIGKLTNDAEAGRHSPSESRPISMVSGGKGNSISSPVASTSGVQNQNKRGVFSITKKKTALTEADLEKMKAGMTKWMEEVRKNQHITKEDNMHEKSQSGPVTSKEPTKPPVKASQKKGLCPYFGSYRPPKRIKPRPYVSQKMYKFLESKLQPQFKMEARIRAEEFVTFMCQHVESTIKKKSKYHKYVFELRNEMVSLGIIKTQFEFHLFIEDYLPESYRIKAIPCYGSSKGPTLDVKDLHEDLSLK